MNIYPVARSTQRDRVAGACGYLFCSSKVRYYRLCREISSCMRCLVVIMGLTTYKLREYNFKDQNRTFVWILPHRALSNTPPFVRVTILARDSIVYFIIILGAHNSIINCYPVLIALYSACIIVKEVMGELNLTLNLDLKPCVFNLLLPCTIHVSRLKIPVCFNALHPS